MAEQITYPYNDEDMTYDVTKHRYTLTAGCVLTNLGINLSTYLDPSGDSNNSTLAERTLDRLSQHLYRSIYKLNPAMKNWTEYLLAKMPELRDKIKEWLLNEVYYNLKNGDFYNYADSEIPEFKAISPDTRDGLYEPLSNGVVLGYSGVYTIPKMTFREDY